MLWIAVDHSSVETANTLDQVLQLQTSIVVSPFMKSILGLGQQHLLSSYPRIQLVQWLVPVQIAVQLAHYQFQPQPRALIAMLPLAWQSCNAPVGLIFPWQVTLQHSHQLSWVQLCWWRVTCQRKVVRLNLWGFYFKTYQTWTIKLCSWI